MKPSFILFVLLLSAGCGLPTLRPSIEGVILDEQSGKPIPVAIVSNYDGTDTLAESSDDGHFFIPAVKDSKAMFPGEERGKLAPNSDKIVLKKDGYVNDTIFIFDKKFTNSKETISLATIKLHAITP